MGPSPPRSGCRCPVAISLGAGVPEEGPELLATVHSWNQAGVLSGVE